MGAGRSDLRRPSLLAAVLLASAAGVLRAQQDTAVVEVVVEVTIARGTSVTMFALARDTALLVPTRAFLDLAAVRVSEVVPGRRLAGMLEPGNVPFAIETPTNVVTRGESILPFAGADAVWRDDELYVAMPVLTLLLGVSGRMDWSELVLAVGNAERLPAIVRLAREQRRAAMLRVREPPPVPGAVAASQSFVDGAVLDWALTSPTRGALERSSLQLDFGMQLGGGSLEVQHSRSLSESAGAETRWQWSVAWPRRSWVRQVRVGEVVTGGPRPRLVRGGVITNSPYLRPAEFGEEPLGGTVGRGWEVESYRAAQLAGFASADTAGRFRLDVPVNYGPNPLELVAYGPSGEVERRSLALLVPSERLPSRRFEYSVGGGRCPTGECRDAFLADVRYGLSDRITVRAGVDAFRRDSLGDLRHPWALASAGLLTSVSVLAEVVGDGLVRGRADYDPSPDFHLGLGHVRYDTSVVRPLVGSSSVRDQTDAALFWRPGGSRSPFFLQAQASRSRGGGTTRDLQRASGTLAALGVRTMLGVQRLVTGSGEGTADIAGTTVDLSLDGVLGGVFRRVATLVRAAVAGSCTDDVLRCVPRAQRASLGTGRQLVGPVRLDLEATWLRGRSGLGLTVTLTTLTSAMRVVSRNGYTRESGFQGTQVFEGSVLFDRRSGQFDLGSGRAIGRGGLAGVVFEDLDGNGYRDEGEPGIGDILLRVGSYAVHTDSLGRFSVSDLVPFEQTVIEIDTLALDNPLWVPASVRMTVSPSPNSFRFVALPILIGGEVNGQLVMGDQARGLGGIPIELRHLGTGVVRTARTFSDGAFYVAGLRPGTYTVAVPADILERLRVTMRPVVFTVSGTAGENAPQVNVTLEPIPAP